MPPPYRLRFEMVGQSRPRDAVTSSISGFFVMDYLRYTTLGTGIQPFHCQLFQSELVEFSRGNPG